MGARIMIAVLVVALACDPGPDCLDEEVTVKVNGTCTPQPPRTVTFEARACQLRARDASGSLGLPLQGALGQAEEPFRAGNWQLYGLVCPPGASSCVAEQASFRRCLATRIAWRLELECVDGAGVPVCRAELTE